MSSDSWLSELEKLDVGMDVMVEGCGVTEGCWLGTTEDEGDIGGVWRDNFMMEMILTRTLDR